MQLKILENFELMQSVSPECDVFLYFSCAESRSDYIAKNYQLEFREEFRIVESDLSCLSGEGGLFSRIKQVFSKIEGDISIFVDISCMPRLIISDLLASATCDRAGEVELVALYSLAEYSPPTEEDIVNEAIEPVHKRFAGWSTPDTKPTSLILGLGYEVNQAEGGSEFFEPSEQWVFVPKSPIVEFFDSVEKNNSSLIFQSEKKKLIEYDVLNPSLTFGQLEMVVGLLAEKTNPILLPFGPKIFFFLCLVQCFNHPELGVWHFSNKGNYNFHRGVMASGRVTGVRCVFAQL